jgi:hypothetical protein
MVTACTPALRPYLTARSAESFNRSLPPQVLRVLPGGAVDGWGFHPLEMRRLFSARANNGHWRCQDAYFKATAQRSEFVNPTSARKRKRKGTWLSPASLLQLLSICSQSWSVAAIQTSWVHIKKVSGATDLSIGR